MLLNPMLAGKAPKDLAKLRFPYYLSPKLDGVRATVQGGIVMSRSLKPIPNKHVQELFGHLEGYDGELIVGDPTSSNAFRVTTSGVMTLTGAPEVCFHVFDSLGFEPWTVRQDRLIHGGRVVHIKQHYVEKAESVTRLEQYYLALGFEGVMLRHPHSPYKHGRSTTNEGYLLKVKQFLDSEAVVVGMQERLHNANEATTNALGYTERSNHSANMVPTGTMGALEVKDLRSGVEFCIGTGFDDAERAWWWSQGAAANGLIVKYSYFPSGSKDKPRFPAYLGQRARLDLY